MAATLAIHPQQTPSKPISIRPQAMKVEPPTFQRPEPIKTRNSDLGVMSPVNENGSFEFDRVIKRGTLVKRTRKTKQWRSVYVVLRPNLLSIYRDKDETKLRHQISLADITAVARQRDSKKKMEHVFGIFSPARNYHLSAQTEKDAQSWVTLIRIEARIGEGDEEMTLMSPVAEKTFAGFDRTARRREVGSSSSEAEPRPSSSMAPETMHSARRPSHTLQYSGNEHGSYSDFSDTGGPVHATCQASMTSLPRTPRSSAQIPNASQQNSTGTAPDDNRVICHGWLWVLKKKGGVRQWKKVWVVLRPRALGLYKNDQEYSANLIIPFENLIDAVDIDAASKSKQHCMQVISEDKNLRFCAADENSLAKWLGAFKSLLVKRKESLNQRTLPTTGTAEPPRPPKTVAIQPPTPTTA